jgi:uncharacterized protein YcbX
MLNMHIDDTSFRPNIVLNGGLLPYEEDEWQKVSPLPFVYIIIYDMKHIQIGEHKFMSLGGCNRCKMITIDQKSGTEGSEPLRTLAHYRRAITGHIFLCILFSPPTM